MLYSDVLGERAVDAEVRASLQLIEDRLAGTCLDTEIKKRGHFGYVLRASLGKVYFDALPAKHWVKFYFSQAANRLPGLGWDSLRHNFADAEQRPKDLVVSIRLRHRHEAATLCAMIEAAVSGNIDLAQA